MSSNNINTSSNENSTLIQISNNNVKYYEELAEQYAKSAEKSLSECAAYLSSAQRCITECQNVKDSMTVSLDDMLGEHTDNLDNPHEVTAEQIDAYTKSEIDTILIGQTVNLSTYYTAVEVDAIAAEKQDNLTAGVDIEITEDNVINATVDLSGYYTADEVNTIAAEKQDNLTAGVDIEITEDNVINATVDLSGYYTSDTVDAALDTKADTELSNITASAGSVISALADSEIDYYTPNHIIVAEGDYSSYTTTLSSGTEYFDLSYYFQNTNAQCYICDFVTSIGSSSTDNAFYYTELEHESGEIYWGQTTIPINRTTSGSTQSQTQFSAYVPACAPYLVIEHTVAGLIVGLIAIKPLKHLPLTDKTWLTYGARTYYGEYETEVNNNNVYITDDNE